MYYYPHSFLKKGRGYCNRLRQSVRRSACPLCYLLLNHWTKFNLIWCVSYRHEWGVQHQTFIGPAPWGPGEGSKGQISFNFQLQSQFQRFLNQTLCVLTNERYITYQTEFSFCPLGHASGMGLWGAGGAQGVKKIFFKHGHVVYQIDRDDEHNRMQVKFSS